MATASEGGSDLLPVNRTLTRVVILMRLLGWAWMVILILVAMFTVEPEPEVPILIGTLVLGTAGTVLTLFAASRGFLGDAWYVVFDGALALLLVSAGWFARTDFVSGGYPASWLFIVAFATSFRATIVIGVIATAIFALLHLAMELDPTRLFGSIQFLVVAVVVGWAFDALRERELLRIRAETERAQAEAQLAAEQEKSMRLEERTNIARRLHDSVLQTLKLISDTSDNASEVRYLARVQERDLRRTINEYQSPFEDSFRARLLDVRATVEDRFRVEIEQVIKDDAEMDDRLIAVVAATEEALNNAALHSGVRQIDLFCEVRHGVVQLNVRDRGRGFDPEMVSHGGLADSVVRRVEAVGGTAHVKSAPGHGTEVSIRVPLS
ncbi:MAG: ATP-binding protein [Acidimicrobiia bacterium]